MTASREPAICADCTRRENCVSRNYAAVPFWDSLPSPWLRFRRCYNDWPSTCMQRLRVSAISFLNTAPLMWDFDHGPLRREYEVDYTLPSVCAEMLSAGTADIGIIPVAAYGSIPDLVVIPDVAIAARGAVRSILLISKVPLEQIKSVAVDTSSRTSVALLQVLFNRYYGRATSLPNFQPMRPKLKPMLAACDAA